MVCNLVIVQLNGRLEPVAHICAAQCPWAHIGLRVTSLRDPLTTRIGPSSIKGFQMPYQRVDLRTTLH
ncbi:Uncharacterized protein TCM_035314 [Theobroma cacao]|uniref:Uncharacterized protein n=1 Tax=Theobroma cacao TaxID=3641 RepID=A0A061FHW9_THECC|nr:Uncharacterized protein TCM_035314 [Theobroma cacao]